MRTNIIGHGDLQDTLKVAMTVLPKLTAWTQSAVFLGDSSHHGWPGAGGRFEHGRRPEQGAGQRRWATSLPDEMITGARLHPAATKL